MLESLNHPNIIKYYDSFTWKNKYCIVMEYAENGNFKNFGHQKIENSKLGDLHKRVKEAKNNEVFIEEATVYL